jgi:hypothetical protein
MKRRTIMDLIVERVEVWVTTIDSDNAERQRERRPAATELEIRKLNPPQGGHAERDPTPGGRDRKEPEPKVSQNWKPSLVRIVCRVWADQEEIQKGKTCKGEVLQGETL